MVHFYPRTLTRNWYMADVCDSIFTSLEGIKRWTSSCYESKIERAAYLETFERCQEIVREHDMRPKEMLQALSDYHDEILLLPKPPFFTLARWIYEPLKARDAAVRVAFNLVEGVSKRFLP
jgi:hypothetical protein